MTAGHVILGVLFGLSIAGGLLIGWLPFPLRLRLTDWKSGSPYSSLYFYRLDLRLYGRRIPFARP